MTNEQRFLAGERFSIKERVGVYSCDNVDMNQPYEIQRHVSLTAIPFYEGLAWIKDGAFECETVFMGKANKERFPFSTLHFDNLEYLDGDMPY